MVKEGKKEALAPVVRPGSPALGQATLASRLRVKVKEAFLPPWHRH
jgi:hypothetical protein